MILKPPIQRDVPDELGRFGKYGGQFVPETLMAALGELESRVPRRPRRRHILGRSSQTS